MIPPSGTREPIVDRKSGNDPADDLTDRALRLRIRQQELLAELGVLALQGTSFIEILNHTARMTAEGLRAEYCKVMEYIIGFSFVQVLAGTKGSSAMPALGLIWPHLQVMPCVPASL